jgi:class 3 adenylate cyclase/Tol biopolymer transport system component
MAQDVEHRLAAILSADVVGYSRLMAEDEESTVRTLTAYREEIGLLVRQHRGRVVDSPGDNLLAEFPTATDAVRCAIEVQGILGVRNAGLPADRRMQFRIGIHLGEVRIEGERIYGDGVNIAARLEGLADPGGVCISAEAHGQVRRKLVLNFEDLGNQSVKNIPEPVRAYRARLGDASASAAVRPSTRSRAIAAGVALLVVALGIFVVYRYFAEPSPGRPAGTPSFSGRRLAIPLPDSAPLAFVGSAPLGVGRTALDLSPDGRLLVYAGRRTGGGTQLYIRPLDRFEIRALPGTEGAYLPFFSPDSQWVGFFAEDQLKKVSVVGGRPIALADAVNPYGGAWWTEGRILFTSNEGARLLSIPASGGTPTELDLRYKGSSTAVLIWSPPEVLPNGKYLLFSNIWNDMFAYDVDSGIAAPLLIGGTNPRYLSPGVLLFSRKSDLMAVTFDPERLAILSEPMLVAEGVRSEGFRQAQFSIGGDGLIVYAPGAHAMDGSLSIIDREGRAESLGFPAGIFSPPTFSPDGDSVAVGVLEVTWDIWILDLESRTRRRLTREGNNQAPVWSSDGERLFFMSDRGETDTYDLYSIPARGAERSTAVLEDAVDLLFPSVAADGRQLIVKAGAAPAIYVLSSADGAETPPREVASGGLARISADGDWTAYTSDETGRYEVYVAPTNGQGARVQLSVEGGEEPVWSPSDDRIFFRNGTALMEVPIEVGASTIRAGMPTIVFDDPAWVNLIGHSYDVTPDGSRFLIVRSDQGHSTSEVRIIESAR